MEKTLEGLAVSFSDPVHLFGHFTYALLILSMLMRNLAWLRVLAVASGIAKIVYRQFMVFDPVSVAWEVAFVAVNLGQLALMWWENRERSWLPHEREFLATFDPTLPPGTARTLLGSGVWHEVPTDAVLTVQGQPVDTLLYIASGVVRIDSGGRAVAHCGPGDFLGEMTWQSRAPATGTAVSEGPVMYLRFDRARLQAAMKKRPLLKFALQSSFNRNLIDKLARSNEFKAVAG